MTFHVEAIIENGMIKPLTAIPFAEQTRVQVVIQPEVTSSAIKTTSIRDTAGILGWTGTQAELDALINDEDSLWNQ
jgi:predicted DNA-binding antitoxin AbrB/MazE fold protein